MFNLDLYTGGAKSFPTNDFTSWKFEFIGKMELKKAVSLSLFDSCLWVLVLSFGVSFMRSIAVWMENGVSEVSGLVLVLRSLILCAAMVCVISTLAMSSFNLTLPFAFLHKLNFFNPKVSGLAQLVICFHFVSFVLIYHMQQYYTQNILTMDNFYDKSGKFDFFSITETWIAAPIREELVFRAVLVNLYYTIFKQYGFNKAQVLQAQVFGPSLFFSLIHLSNFVGSPFSSTYIGLQISLGFVIGTFYALRFIASDNIWETIVLHIANNIVSIFTPSGDQLDLTNSLTFASFVLTFVVYLCLNYFCWNRLRTELVGDETEFNDYLRKDIESLKEKVNSAHSKEMKMDLMRETVLLIEKLDDHNELSESHRNSLLSIQTLLRSTKLD